MAAVKMKLKVEWSDGDDSYRKRFSRRLSICTLCRGHFPREPEDVFSILSELAVNVHRHQSGQELNPGSKDGQRIRIGVVA